MRIGHSLSVAIIVSCLGAAAAHAVPTITVAPGPSPAGYIPLYLFGATPQVIGDDEIIDLAVPAFNYAGETWTDIGISSNGIVVVGGSTSLADSTFVNTPLPNALNPNNVLAPFWTDLDPSDGGGVYTATLTDGVSTWIVIDWNAVPLFGQPTEENSFEIWIGVASNPDPEDISFVYDVISSSAFGFLTVGAEDKTGTVGDTYFFNGAGSAPTQFLELQVTWEDLPVEVVAVPEPATLALFGAGLAGLAVIRRRRKAKT